MDTKKEDFNEMQQQHSQSIEQILACCKCKLADLPAKINKYAEANKIETRITYDYLYRIKQYGLAISYNRAELINAWLDNRHIKVPRFTGTAKDQAVRTPKFIKTIKGSNKFNIGDKIIYTTDSSQPVGTVIRIIEPTEACDYYQYLIELDNREMPQWNFRCREKELQSYTPSDNFEEDLNAILKEHSLKAPTIEIPDNDSEPKEHISNKELLLEMFKVAIRENENTAIKLFEIVLNKII